MGDLIQFPTLTLRRGTTAWTCDFAPGLIRVIAPDARRQPCGAPVSAHEPLSLDFRDAPEGAVGLEFRSRCSCGWVSEWWRAVMNAARAFHWHASESDGAPGN